MAKKMAGHDDAAQDKKLFKTMMKKAMPKGKVAAHLKEDVKEQAHGIKKDVKLLKTLKKAK